jgi:glycosyltransferase involved in cell wall biosynthesis
MFPNGLFTLSRNAIDAATYLFDADARTHWRNKLRVEDKFVIGHVGRLAPPKNHDFLLRVFLQIRKTHPNSVLMLIGDGELEAAVRAKADQLGISDSVLFMGRQSNVGELMSAMDLFVLPSLYEGLGIVLVEAQCNGLPCVVSQEAYNEEVTVYPDLLSVLPLSCGAEKWANHILSKDRNLDRNVDLSLLGTSGYDMKTEIKKLEELYLQAEKGT